MKKNFFDPDQFINEEVTDLTRLFNNKPELITASENEVLWELISFKFPQINPKIITLLKEKIKIHKFRRALDATLDKEKFK